MDTQYWDEKYRSRDQLFSGAPNGVLVTEVADLPPGRALVASHDLADLSPRHDGVDPGDYYQPDDIARLLDHGWAVLINETRPRTSPTPADTHHIRDVVLRAQRRG